MLLERFKQGHNNLHVKTLVRVRDAVSMHDLHVPLLPPGRVAVTSGFRPCATLSPEMPTDYSGGQLNHYWNKSFQEFVFRRMRGDGTLDHAATQKDFDKFFVWGQAVRPDDLIEPSIIERVKQEVSHLLTLPGVREAAERVERGFQAVLAEYDRKLGLHQLYESFMKG